MTLLDVRFNFVCDTKQGPLLSYGRSQAPLEITETLQIVGNYVHFTVKDANWLITGSDSNANNDFGTGFLELNFSNATKEIFSIQWMTYYTNGAVKEVLMRIDPISSTHIKTYNPS